MVRYVANDGSGRVPGARDECHWGPYTETRNTNASDWSPAQCGPPCWMVGYSLLSSRTATKTVRPLATHCCRSSILTFKGSDQFTAVIPRSAFWSHRAAAVGRDHM